VRTPDVDVPIAALSGEAPPGVTRLCALFGSTVPFAASALVELYGDRSRYVAAYEESLDATIAQGFLLESDRDVLVARAQHASFPF
jgi:hypothetical protein